MALSDGIKEQLNKITNEDIELYLQLWNYDGISFEGNTEELVKLKEICNSEESVDATNKNVLKVSNQNENSIENAESNVFGIGQLLYDLEVIADIPGEIREQVSKSEWIEFINRFIDVYSGLGWNVYFSKNTPFSRLTKGGLLPENASDDNVYEKYMIINNGNGGRVSSLYGKYKANKRVESIRLIVLFRVYVMELLCDYFRKELNKNDVEVLTVNWNWALNNPVYPNETPSSLELEENTRYSVSQIANNENEFEEFLKEIYGGKYALDYVREVMDIPNRLKMENGSVEHEDRYGKNLNVIKGERKTTDQPEDYDNTIYLMGGCVFFGYAVEDGDTIASFLQRKLNAEMPEKKWRVVNYGTWGGDIDWTYKRFYKINFKPGDVVIVSYAGLMPVGNEWQKRDISKYLKNVISEKQFYFNGIVHCNRLGYEQVAIGMYENFKELLSKDSAKGENFYLKDNFKEKKVYEQQVAEYVEQIKDELPDLTNRHVGAIVMNCNPFTLGHQYLIEYSSRQVDVLIIFVVEENKSYFKFEDRIELVKQGTAHLDNVYVVPSGKMIISTVTFPGYFLKDTPEAVGLDTSLDVSIFGEYIAKAFDIKTRFVGEEPLDIVTRNYNESMKRILPQHGIELVIIPRKEMGESVISASRVRKLLESKNFEEIKELVPETTYNFLLKNYQ